MFANAAASPQWRGRGAYPVRTAALVRLRQIANRALISIPSYNVPNDIDGFFRLESAGRVNSWLFTTSATRPGGKRHDFMVRYGLGLVSALDMERAR
jgi:hypothetical protein